ncbi:potassium channel subfamily T member 2 [Aplysia californica]|uniref:Potassium channel subfamily T member 2 n=1 Tax=Aplysia californica TaxID=6500 RepID=A0ABM0ZYA3_APLCA|nr:potassium channel subfamily T member 2 [Aplysia californica]
MTDDDDIGDGDCDGIDFKWMRNDSDSESEEEDWTEREGTLPKFPTRELSLRARLRRILLRNPTTRINISVVYISLKVLLCCLYVVRVCLDDVKQYACHGGPCNGTVEEDTDEGFTSTNINWHVLLWVNRPLPLWVVQILLSAITFFKSTLLVLITMKGNVFLKLTSRDYVLEVLCSLPMVVSVSLWTPQFLNCWLALISLKRLLNDFHLARQRFQTMSVTLYQQSWFLIATLGCLIFTTICGIQHIQRGSHKKPLNMFEAVYFVIVTLSTVGYGDISPDIWLGQLFMLFMICVAFSFIPRQLEEIGSTWSQRKKMGGDFRRKASAKSKHVVVIGTEFTTESVMNFLNEFFEHPKLEFYTVILMSSEELDDNMQFILKDPKWANRVLYIRGSALKDIDLKRCRIHEAEACFFLINKSSDEVEKADQHTVLRSWAVKDFAPHCAQYIQLYKASNKIHVKFAEHVVSEDEFKFALLANNCLYPGLSTLVTLLLHTSRGHEGSWAPETWQQIYGLHSGNEIYHIQLHRSIFFREYEGKKFTYASLDAHQKYGVNLIAVLDTTAVDAQLQLNPGSDYVMRGTDYCFYMSLTREEYMKAIPKALEATKSASEVRNKNIAIIVKEMNKLMEAHEADQEEIDEESVFSTITSNIGSNLGKSLKLGLEALPLLEKENARFSSTDSGGGNMSERVESFDRVQGATNYPSKIVQQMIDFDQESFTIGPPPSTLNLGTRRTLCHLHKDSRSLCCLEWGKPCEHCQYKVASDKRWDHQLVILSVRRSCPGLYNFIIPLRSKYLSLLSLSPIILMFQEVPSRFFLETIAHFPLVFWMQGTVNNLDDLLTAGVNKAMHLVISHMEAGPGGEENLHDAATIVTVQKISRLFPHVNIITEVNEASNMRFMHFKAKDSYMLKIRKLEKRLKERAVTNLPYMFRLPFAAGQVFSSGMLDRLLYQTFVKGYLISFVRLLLGIDAEKNSGHLSSVRIRRATLSQFPTYGDLYQGLCSTTGEIPIAIFRTDKQSSSSEGELPTESNGNNNIKPEKLSGLRDSLRHGFHLPHSHLHSQRQGLRSSRMSVGAGFFERDKHSNQHLEEMVQARMESLQLADDDEPYVISKPPKALSYVIVNPTPKRKLRNGDMVYVIQPSSMQAVPNKLNRSGRSPAKSFRSRHISVNVSGVGTSKSSSTPTSTPSPRDNPAPKSYDEKSQQPSPVELHGSLAGFREGSPAAPNGTTVVDFEKEDSVVEMRPRCKSESSAKQANSSDSNGGKPVFT